MMERPGHLKKAYGTYENSIEQHLKSLEIVGKYLNHPEPYRRLQNHAMCGNSCRDIGGLYVLLGNRKKGIEYFVQAVHYYLKAHDFTASQKAGPQISRLIDSAILSRERELQSKAAAVCLDAKAFGLAFAWHRIRLVSNLVLNNDDKVIEIASRMKKIEKREGKRAGYSEGVASVGQGIVDKDDRSIKTGIDQILSTHVTKYIDRIEDSPWLQICLPAVVLLLLARDRGMDVWKEIDSEYIPKILFQE